MSNAKKKAFICVVVSVLVILFLGWKVHTLTVENKNLQAVQNRIDLSFTQSVSELVSDLFNKSDVSDEQIAIDVAQVQLLLPVTTYKSENHIEDIVNKLIWASKNPDQDVISEEIAQEIQALIYKLNKPLPEDFNQQSDQLWSKISENE